MDRILTYASPPPRDRAEVVWQGRDFEITLPPQQTGARMMILTPLAILLLMIAYMMFIMPEPAHVIALVYGPLIVLMVLAGVRVLRQMRTWTRITLRDDMLIFTIPALCGTSITRCSLDQIDHATVGPAGRRDRASRVLLWRRDGGCQPILNDIVFRQSDLFVIAKAINHAISRRVAGD